MRAATLAVSLIALAAAACQQDRSDQNIAMDNGMPANADIEALPPDESSATPSDELANGSDNADVSDLNASANSY
ncbi:MAG: hypothetical protein ACJ8D5_03400 [Sphingomicrobium sp.]